MGTRGWRHSVSDIWYIDKVTGDGSNLKGAILSFQTGRIVSTFSSIGLKMFCFGTGTECGWVGTKCCWDGTRHTRSVFPPSLILPPHHSCTPPLHFFTPPLCCSVACRVCWRFCAPCSCFAWLCRSTFFGTVAAGFHLLSRVQGHTHGH